MSEYFGPLLVALIILIGAIGVFVAFLVGIVRWILALYRKHAGTRNDWRNRWH